MGCWDQMEYLQQRFRHVKPYTYKAPLSVALKMQLDVLLKWIMFFIFSYSFFILRIYSLGINKLEVFIKKGKKNKTLCREELQRVKGGKKKTEKPINFYTYYRRYNLSICNFKVNS